MMRVELESMDLVYLAIAFVLNDELYSFCREMVTEP